MQLRSNPFLSQSFTTLPPQPTDLPPQARQPVQRAHHGAHQQQAGVLNGIRAMSRMDAIQSLQELDEEHPLGLSSQPAQKGSPLSSTPLSLAQMTLGPMTRQPNLSHVLGAEPGKAQPALAVKMPIQFGILHYCGVCPLCVAGAWAQDEAKKIKQMKNDRTGLVEIKRGSSAAGARAEAFGNGRQLSLAFIGNPDGTRLQPIVTSHTDPDLVEEDSLQVAALKRIPMEDGSGNYQVDFSEKGAETTLFDYVIGGVVGCKNGTNAYEIESPADAPPLNYDLENPVIPVAKTAGALLFDHSATDNVPFATKTLGIYHHLNFKDPNESPVDAEASRKTKPLFLGYVSFTQVNPNELVLVSTRELPGFEELGITEGGVMNLMGLAAQRDDLDSLVVAVEPFQPELEHYLTEDLKDKEIPVSSLPYSDSTEYAKLFPEGGGAGRSLRPKLFKIDVGPLHHLHQSALAQAMLGEMDGSPIIDKRSNRVFFSPDYLENRNGTGLTAANLMDLMRLAASRYDLRSVIVPVNPDQGDLKDLLTGSLQGQPVTLSAEDVKTARFHEVFKGEDEDEGPLAARQGGVIRQLVENAAANQTEFYEINLAALHGKTETLKAEPILDGVMQSLTTGGGGAFEPKEFEFTVRGNAALALLEDINAEPSDELKAKIQQRVLELVGDIDKIPPEDLTFWKQNGLPDVGMDYLRQKLRLQK